MSFATKSIEVSFRSKKRFFCRIRKLIKQVWQGYKLWEILEKNRRQLMAMNDYYLKDIGISRADAVRFSRQRESLWSCIFKKTNAENYDDVA